MTKQASHSARASWVDLSGHNTLAVPARAKKLVLADTYPVLVSAIQQAKFDNTPYLVLGEGSNTVFVDDFNGTVILNRLSGIKVLEETHEHVVVKAAAGENWHDLVAFSVDQSWHGLENLALIPGLVGAAPIQNIGAYGAEVRETISQVEVYDVPTDSHEFLSVEDCEFGYRDSRFKKDWAGTKVITAVHFRLSRLPKVNINYPALSQRLGEQPSVRDVFDTVVAIRSEKLPDPSVIPNAGSFFKNPIVDQSTLDRLLQNFPDVVYFNHDEKIKLAAAWLIDQAGWKNRVIDGVGVHQKQALVVINPLRSSGNAIQAFSQSVQRDILEKYDVLLEIEPRIVP